jgi:hypothetical protein
MLAAAERGLLLLIDGFIVTSALLVAAAIAPAIRDYCVFCHRSAEPGHLAQLRALHAEPLLDLGLRLGEGTAPLWPGRWCAPPPLSSTKWPASSRPASRDALIAWLRAGPRRLVLIDDLQRLYLRGVDTRAAWSALSALIIGAGPRVFWICTISRLADEYLRWAARDAAPFRARVELSGWPEEQIAALLRRRTAAAGYTVRYDDLIVDRLEGVESHAQLISTEIEYARLIWDYADGSPAVALESWRSSLVLAEAKRVHVRLFRRPEEAKLEQLTQPQRFILASVVWHHSLTAEEATASLRFGLAACEEALERLRESGVLTKSGPRYRPATTWLPAIGRFLRRNHLIEAL